MSGVPFWIFGRRSWPQVKKYIQSAISGLQDSLQFASLLADFKYREAESIISPFFEQRAYLPGAGSQLM
mgnify:CR=1 FL=1